MIYRMLSFLMILRVFLKFISITEIIARINIWKQQHAISRTGCITNKRRSSAYHCVLLMFWRKSEHFEVSRSIARFLVHNVLCMWLNSVGEGGVSDHWRARVLPVGNVCRRMSSWQPGAAHPVRLLRTLYTRRSLHRLQLRTYGLRSWRHRRCRAQLLRQEALHVSCDVTARRQQQQRRVPAGPHSAPACQVYLPERWGN